ncbi:coil containing protein [Vibrio phage vB_VhaS_R21Y]|nr:coil containing protein [Vibrio phage vB_VcaS_HC]WKV32859.1 coil containing protein [Vibrio phage vB_VhaS_R21Y]
MAFKIAKLAKKAKEPRNTNPTLPKREPKGLTAAQVEAIGGYKVYQGVDTEGALVLKELIKFNVSSYQKIKMLMVSAIESGKPSETKKMRGFLRGFKLPGGDAKLTKEIDELEVLFDNYGYDGDPSYVYAAFAASDTYLKA